jgi:hypothetical protein
MYPSDRTQDVPRGRSEGLDSCWSPVSPLMASKFLVQGITSPFLFLASAGSQGCSSLIGNKIWCVWLTFLEGVDSAMLATTCSILARSYINDKGVLHCLQSKVVKKRLDPWQETDCLASVVVAHLLGQGCTLLCQRVVRRALLLSCFKSWRAMAA